MTLLDSVRLAPLEALSSVVLLDNVHLARRPANVCRVRRCSFGSEMELDVSLFGFSAVCTLWNEWVFFLHVHSVEMNVEVSTSVVQWFVGGFLQSQASKSKEYCGGPWILGWQNCNSRAQILEPHLLVKVHSASAPGLNHCRPQCHIRMAAEIDIAIFEWQTRRRHPKTASETSRV